ncbi:YheC/YheD family protein [Brevibacillus sp. SYSU BS000544]|uniref:YheC/YheD family endospore coat-associated protein n=1 Tax=Brevibacillus sp. SYSU BS000544 TaxID=3416443 RepID=UPI003CE477CA
MESLLVRLRFLNYSQVAGIIMPLQMLQQLQLRPRQQIVITLGKKEVTTTVFQDKQNIEGNIVKITSLLKKQLNIPHGGLIHLKKEEETLRIGPSIGIVTTGVRQSVPSPMGNRTSFFHKLLTAQKGKGVFYYIFSPTDVDWDRQEVDAWFLRPDKQGNYVWKRMSTPLPDVVYDRIPSRAAERLDSVQQFKLKWVAETKLPLFNDGFFDKWNIYRLLYPNLEVQEHIPETHILPTLEKVKMMIRKYRMIYLKPKNGSLGYGIVKLTRKLDKGYEVSYHSNIGNTKRTFKTVSAAFSHIARTRKLGSYLIQRGINLCTYQNRPFDFRVHLHKNQENAWVVSCMAAKVAGTGSVTTHVRTGGTVIPGEELLQYLFGQQKELVSRRIRDAAFRLATAIEEANQAPLGELGLDMGIDTHGQVWMFEANSKPGRSIFKHSRLKEADNFSRTLIVDYSRYLANF